MNVSGSQAAILAIGTAVPPHQMEQPALGEWVAETLKAPPSLRRWLRHLYQLSGIERRYSCLPDGAELHLDSRFAPGRARAETPTTAERMAIYERESVLVGSAAAQRALAAADEPLVAETVTHLIVVSCTGFFAPGLDLAIARRLGLRPTVQRTLVGFMGCAAAFNGLRLAAQIVAGQPAARVLVVCVELCTLHIQSGDDRINLTVASLFADGAAACLVGAPRERGHLFAINSFFTAVKPDSEGAMAWQIGDHGFVMNLSPQVPRHVSEIAWPALSTLLDGRPRPEFWALHPGGRAILDRLAEVFELNAEQAAASYNVLRHYGNMSSATVLFVLHELLERLQAANSSEPVDGVAVAFGPGLVTEMAHLTYVPSLTLELPERQTLSGAALELSAGD